MLPAINVELKKAIKEKNYSQLQECINNDRGIRRNDFFYSYSKEIYFLKEKDYIEEEGAYYHPFIYALACYEKSFQNKNFSMNELQIIDTLLSYTDLVSCAKKVNQKTEGWVLNYLEKYSLLNWFLKAQAKRNSRLFSFVIPFPTLEFPALPDQKDNSSVFDWESINPINGEMEDDVASHFEMMAYGSSPDLHYDFVTSFCLNSLKKPKFILQSFSPLAKSLAELVFSNRVSCSREFFNVLSLLDGPIIFKNIILHLPEQYTTTALKMEFLFESYFKCVLSEAKKRNDLSEAFAVFPFVTGFMNAKEILESILVNSYGFFNLNEILQFQRKFQDLFRKSGTGFAFYMLYASFMKSESKSFKKTQSSDDSKKEILAAYQENKLQKFTVEHLKAVIFLLGGTEDNVLIQNEILRVLLDKVMEKNVSDLTNIYRAFVNLCQSDSSNIKQTYSIFEKEFRQFGLFCMEEGFMFNQLLKRPTSHCVVNLFHQKIGKELEANVKPPSLSFF